MAKKYRMVKCAYCKKQLDRNIEDFISKSNKHYHADCYEQFREKADARAELIDYICNLYKIKAPTGVILKQIKRFEEPPYNFKYTGMKMALQYFHELKGNEVYDNAGIGIVEYVYEDARSYFITLDQVKRHNAQVKIDREAEVVKVKQTRPKKKRHKQIDLGSIH